MSEEYSHIERIAPYYRTVLSAARQEREKNWSPERFTSVSLWSRSRCRRLGGNQGDLPVLTQYFVENFSAQFGKKVRAV